MANRLKRTVYCGTPRLADCGGEYTVCGWVARQRDLGNLIFIDVRDRTGILQCVFDRTENAELCDAAFSVRSEFVVGVRGTLRERSNKNPEIPTGDVELLASELVIFSKSETTPFEILDDVNANEALRLKYRYLDLRRPSMQKALADRHRITQIARRYFDSEGFLEIETPILMKSTPEGARDYLVPSRVHPGRFYALPQSPQQYKQLLMLSGFDRYFQVARCFRDEDLRADRQPEFTQIDLEMSFVEAEDVMAVNEGFLKKLFSELMGIEITLPLPRIPYKEAMSRYGSDKPDTRFGMEICDITEILKDSELSVFSDAAAGGGFIGAINAKGLADRITRKNIDALGEFVKDYRARGLAWIKLSGGQTSCSFAKYLTEEQKAAITTATGAGDSDVIFIIADKKTATAQVALGALRCEIARKYDLIDPNKYNLLWVTEFPLFEYSEEEDRFVAMHHPFTSPVDEDLPFIESDPGAVRAKAYDIVLNGVELGGGSIRIHDADVQKKMFRALGFTDQSAYERFGYLLDAFKFGVPPHGGLAYGLDRLCMLLGGYSSIRDVIAFPKVQNASELMTNSPDAVDKIQLDELHIALKDE